MPSRRIAILKLTDIIIKLLQGILCDIKKGEVVLEDIKSDLRRSKRKFSFVEVVSNVPEQISYIKQVAENFPFYAYIIHDKDKLEDGSLKKPHIHCVVSSTPKTFQTWANLFEVPVQFVSKLKGGPRSACRYLIHKNAPEKAQYLPEQITTNDSIRLKSYLVDSSERTPQNNWSDFVDLREGKISISDFMNLYSLEISKMSFYNKLRFFDWLYDMGGGCGR